MKNKPWGKVDLLYQTAFMYVEKIWVNIGGQSSIHLHKKKVNMFIVESGKLRIYTEHNGWVLSPSEEISIKPKIQHQFIALTKVVAYEIYYAVAGNLPVNIEDIERFNKWN